MQLSGSITALATPFTATGEVDVDAWQRLLALQLEGGTQGIVVAGSTGEAAALYDPEFDTLLRLAVEQAGGRMRVLAGTGLSNTAKTIEQTRRAAALGADAALVVTPPYVRPTQEGLIAHYRAVADDGALPILLYNVPSRTGVDMLPDTVAALVGHERILGIKEAVAEPERMARLLDLQQDGFAVLSGDDPTASRAMLAGAAGVISVASNVLPRVFRRLCDLARAGDTAQVREWEARIAPVNRFLAVEPNPIPVKALLARLSIGQGLRSPLLPLSVAHRGEADAVFEVVRQLETLCAEQLAA